LLPVDGSLPMKPHAVGKYKRVYTHATVVYNDNTSESFKALCVTDKGIFIGRIVYNEYGENEFIEYGFIAHTMVKKIIPTSKDY